MAKRRKMIAAVIVGLMICAAVLAAVWQAGEPVKLSELSEVECMEFIKSRGVKIPDDYEDEMEWAAFVKDTIVQVEQDPDARFVYSYSVIVDFAEAIKAAVNEYYGVEE